MYIRITVNIIYVKKIIFCFIFTYSLSQFLDDIIIFEKLVAINQNEIKGNHNFPHYTQRNEVINQQAF